MTENPGNAVKRRKVEENTSSKQQNKATEGIEDCGACHSVDEYEKIVRIGEGTYGDVYAAHCKSSKRICALKRIIMHNEQQDGFPITSLREISMLRRCSTHPNVVKLLDVVVGKNKGVFLVFEYCEHDLSSLLRHHGKDKSPFTESEVKCLMQQMLSGLAFLHENYIIHRDIKLSNLLYDNRGCLKIADFGLARLFSYPASEHVLTPTVVTLWYRAAEVLMGSQDYSVAIDVWAAGCAMGELLLGYPLIDGDNEQDQLIKIFQLLGNISGK